MPIARIGYGTDFILKNQGVGINTDTTDVKLVVSGTTKADYNITGIATLTNYTGFANAEQNITGHVTLTGEHSSLGDIVVGSGSTLSVSSASTVCIGTLDSVCIYDHFTVPNGGTEDRQECPVEGTVRFNKDLNTLEFYNGVDWRQFTVSGRSGRSVVGGGAIKGGGYSDTLQTFNISTFGNAISFGDLSNGARFSLGSGSDGIRGIFYAGQEGPSSPRDFIDQITMASEGNSIDFGDATTQGRCFGGCGSSTRGIFGGINTGTTCDTIQYATKGSTIASFVTLSIAGGNKIAMFSSPDKLISRSGESSGAAAGSSQLAQNQSIETANIASGGSTTVFGTLSRNTRQVRGTCNNTRGMFFGGYSFYPAYLAENHIDYITISSNGNAVDFGDLTQPRAQPACTAHSTRAVAAGGGGDPWPGGAVNYIDYVTIQSKGNGSDFGDLFQSVSATIGCSDSNGGLGGY